MSKESLIEEINRKIVEPQFKVRGHTLKKQQELVKEAIFQLLLEKELLEFGDINNHLTLDLLNELYEGVMLYRHNRVLERIKKPS